MFLIITTKQYIWVKIFTYTMFFVVEMYLTRAFCSDAIVLSFNAFCPRSSLAILVKMA